MLKLTTILGLVSIILTGSSASYANSFPIPEMGKPTGVTLTCTDDVGRTILAINETDKLAWLVEKGSEQIGMVFTIKEFKSLACESCYAIEAAVNLIIPNGLPKDSKSIFKSSIVINKDQEGNLGAELKIEPRTEANKLSKCHKI